MDWTRDKSLEDISFKQWSIFSEQNDIYEEHISFTVIVMW